MSRFSNLSKNPVALGIVFMWLIALLIGGALILGSLTGFVNVESFAQETFPPIPTVPALPTQSFSTEEPPLAVRPPPTSDITATPIWTKAPTLESYFEATFTPVIPITPSPTFYITPPASDGRSRVIGYSEEDRPIQVWTFGDGPIKRLLVFNIHGGYEWNTTALATELIAQLTDNPEIVPDDITLYIIPTINPDGLVRSLGISGRANANNVDINRNFPYDWREDWNRTGCWDFLPITSGERPLSEPESRTLLNFIVLNKVEAFISYHSAALGIFPGGYPITLPASESLAEAIAEVAPYPYPPIDTGCEIHGMLVDWAATIGVAGVDVELTDHSAIDFSINLRVLDAFLNWRMGE